MERNYAMLRLGPGDWLLPSNDGKTMWRLYVTASTRRRWAIARMPMRQWLTTLGWAEDFSVWEVFDTGLLTRGEAIEAALTVGTT